MVREFVDARDWQQFHSPKNLSMALAIEAAELMEHFQWITPDESRTLGDDPDRLEQVGEELAEPAAARTPDADSSHATGYSVGE